VSVHAWINPFEYPMPDGAVLSAPQLGVQTDDLPLYLNDDNRFRIDYHLDIGGQFYQSVYNDDKAFFVSQWDVLNFTGAVEVTANFKRHWWRNGAIRTYRLIFEAGKIANVEIPEYSWNTEWDNR
jgi:hypothetical protein